MPFNIVAESLGLAKKYYASLDNLTMLRRLVKNHIKKETAEKQEELATRTL